MTGPEVAAMLERVERLPEEWRCSDITCAHWPTFRSCGGWVIPLDIALRLHLSHIAEKLAGMRWTVAYRFSVDRWNVFDRQDEEQASSPTYASALIAAAEACGGRGE